MTNEELATAVQAGEADVLELWDQVRRFALRRAHRWAAAAGEAAGITVEDLVQAGFLALLEAVAGWSADRGPFLVCYILPD